MDKKITINFGERTAEEIKQDADFYLDLYNLLRDDFADLLLYLPEQSEDIRDVYRLLLTEVRVSRAMLKNSFNPSFPEIHIINES